MKKLYFVAFTAVVRRGLGTAGLNGGFCLAASSDKAVEVMKGILERTETGRLTDFRLTGAAEEWTAVASHRRAVVLLSDLRDSLRSGDKEERKQKERVQEKIAGHLAWLNKNAPLAMPSQ